MTNNSEVFIARAKNVHGDKYDYAMTNYINCDEKISIFCSEHGYFLQRPANHLRGSGCPKCGYRSVSRKLTGSGKPEFRPLRAKEEFLMKAELVHGHSYDYSKTKYKRAVDKVEIICPSHGEFWQQPNNHLSGNGCPKCSVERTASALSLSREDFISKMNAVFGNSYDFSGSVYKNSQTKVAAICKIHGEFKQYPLHLQRGVGCNKCGSLKRRKHFQMKLEDFLVRATSMHGDKYDYSNVSFDNLRQKIKIKCKRHGYFDQVAYSHIVGTCCPRCKNSLGEKAVAAWLELNDIEYVTQYAKHDCYINSGLAKFDFYVSDFNVFIEYDGEQHFQPVLFGGTMEEAVERFAEVQRADRKKDEWAKAKGIKLIRVPYVADVSDYLEAELYEFLASNNCVDLES